MKYLPYILLTTVLLIPSCAIKENDAFEDSPFSEELVFHAFADINNKSKASLQENGTEVWWEPGDSIMVFKGDGAGIFIAQNDSVSPEASFIGSLDKYTGQGDVWAVYPASAAASFNSASNRVTVTIPETQIARAGSFDKRAFVAIAKTSTDTLRFRNICGGIKFSVSKTGIDKLTISEMYSEPRSMSGTLGYGYNAYDALLCYERPRHVSHVSIYAGEGKCFIPDVYYYVCIEGGANKEFKYLRFSLYSGNDLIGTYDYPVAKTISNSVFGVISNIDQRLTYKHTELSSPDAVNLALDSGLQWASWNLGASSPEESGAYYAWGEITPKTNFTLNNYHWSSTENDRYSKYVSNSWYGMVDFISGQVDSLTTLLPEDDAATYALKDGWRMPDYSEFYELMDDENVVWIWEDQGTYQGYRVTSKRNGNSIFLPTGGYRADTSYVNTQMGYYFTRGNDVYDRQPNCLRFTNTTRYRGSALYRYYGAQIRPVKDNSKVACRIDLDQTSLQMNRGDITYLHAEVFPKSLEDNLVLWSSSDNSVVSVGADGKLTALNPGMATVKATARAGGVSAECLVEVVIRPSSLSLNYNNLTLYEGTLQLEATIFPEDAQDKRVIWSSDNEKVATVDENGLVTAKMLGYATITATTVVGEVTSTCKLKIGEFSLNASEITFTDGDTRDSPFAFSPTIKHNTLSGTKISYWSKLGWTDVDESNVVTARFNNYTNPPCKDIIIATVGELSDTCLVNLNRFALESIILFPGDEFEGVEAIKTNPNNDPQFNESLAGSVVWAIDEERTDVYYTICKDDVVSLSPTGHLVALKGGGYTVLSITTPDGAISTCTVYVQNIIDNPREPTLVNLGLPSGTLWANHNLGANSYKELGPFYAWGDIVPRKDYSSYCWWDENNKFTKYNSISGYGVVDNRTKLLSQDDAAYVMYGKKYHIPSVEQFEELSKNTEIEAVIAPEFGEKGFVFRSKINGEIIFIPSSGHFDGVNYRESTVSCLGFWANECDNESTKAFGAYIGFRTMINGIPEDIFLAVGKAEKNLGFQIRPIGYQ